MVVFMATENAMTISRKKKKVKRKARTQKKKTTSVSKSLNKNRGKKSQSGRKKKRKVSASTKVKHRPTRAQLEKQLQAAQEKIQRLSRKKSARSAAAKKGWETRRKKRAEQAEISIKEAETLEGIVFSSIDPERLEYLERPDVKRQIQDLYIEKIPEYFVLDGERRESWVQQKEPSILRRLIYAKVEGTFDEVAHDIADEEGYEPNEIYSLWHGYKLED